MKRISFTLLSLMLLAAVSFSALAQGQKREVSGFTTVASAGPFSVHIKLDGTESLRLEADANVINDIETVVENSTLKIKFKNRDNQHNNPGKIDVYVTAKSLNGLINSGSGTMKVDGTINASDFKVVLSGSGNVSTSVKSDELKAVISGSGSINLDGSTGGADMVVTGSGQIHGKGLKTQSAKIVITGSGDVYLIADKSVSAHITGSGSVVYSGNANVVDTRYTGSGRVTKAD
ncbi:MAG TPA: head GIN domain-containing protein [Mucilaginibacter sp.]|nr:head GIN domain-containing protein [Mucilaginibacter sp.]